MKYIHICIHIRHHKVLTVNKSLSHTYILYTIIFHVFLTQILLRKSLGNINQFGMNECVFWFFFSNKILSYRPILNKHKITLFLPCYHLLRLWRIDGAVGLTFSTFKESSEFSLKNKFIKLSPMHLSQTRRKHWWSLKKRCEIRSIDWWLILTVTLSSDSGEIYRKLEQTMRLRENGSMRLVTCTRYEDADTGAHDLSLSDILVVTFTFTSLVIKIALVLYLRGFQICGWYCIKLWVPVFFRNQLIQQL